MLPSPLVYVQVKVVLRVSPTAPGADVRQPVLQVDPSKKRVTVIEPVSKSQSRATMTLDRGGKSLLKTFNVDAAYPQESSQVWISSSKMVQCLRFVLSIYLDGFV